MNQGCQQQLILPLVCVLTPLAAAQAIPAPGRVSESLRRDFQLDDHYSQSIVLDGFPIIASNRVSPVALQEAAWIVREMLSQRRDMLRCLASHKIRLVVMASGERTMDVPEHSDLRPASYWNVRARGLGATFRRRAVSCGEENLLCCKGDPYASESILVHEFAHTLHEVCLVIERESFDARLQSLFDDAVRQAKWKGTYASTDHREYWAEAVQSWFGANRQNDVQHNHVNARRELTAYDPGIAKLCHDVFGGNNWQYVPADDRSRMDAGHLKGLDRDSLPRFRWSAEELRAMKRPGWDTKP